MRQSAAKLSNKMRETRDRLEDDLEETRGVVKDLKDFLSGAGWLSHTHKERSHYFSSPSQCDQSIHSVSLL